MQYIKKIIKIKINFVFLDEREQFESEQVEGGASLWAEERDQIPANFFNTPTGIVYENIWTVTQSVIQYLESMFVNLAVFSIEPSWKVVLCFLNYLV